MRSFSPGDNLIFCGTRRRTLLTVWCARLAKRNDSGTVYRKIAPAVDCENQQLSNFPYDIREDDDKDSPGPQERPVAPRLKKGLWAREAAAFFCCCCVQRVQPSTAIISQFIFRLFRIRKSYGGWCMHRTYAKVSTSRRAVVLGLLRAGMPEYQILISYLSSSDSTSLGCFRSD